MSKEIFDDSDGVWRTINGRKVFIREGQSLASAMRESGKFKKTFRKLDKRNAKEEKLAKQRQAIDEIKNRSKENNSLNNLGIIRQPEDYRTDKKTSLKDTINDLAKKYLGDRAKKYANLKDTDEKGVYRAELADPVIYKHTKDVKDSEYGKLVNKYNDTFEKMTKYNSEKDKAKYEKERQKAKDIADEIVDYRNSHSNKEIMEMQSDKKASSTTINNKIRQEAYKKYLKEHPNSKMSFAEFKDMYKMK